MCQPGCIEVQIGWGRGFLSKHSLADGAHPVRLYQKENQEGAPSQIRGQKIWSCPTSVIGHPSWPFSDGSPPTTCGDDGGKIDPRQPLAGIMDRRAGMTKERARATHSIHRTGSAQWRSSFLQMGLLNISLPWQRNALGRVNTI